MTGTPFNPINDRLSVFSEMLGQMAEVSGKTVVESMFGELDQRYAPVMPPISTVKTTSQTLTPSVLTRINTNEVKSNDTISTTPSVITITKAGKYLITLAADIRIGVNYSNGFVPSAAIYLNDNSASNILNQMLVATDWTYTGGAASGMEFILHESDVREFAAGDQLTIWGLALGANVTSVEWHDSNMTLTQLP